MTKREISEIVGNKSILSDDIAFAAKLNYISGIQQFDDYLNGKTLDQINAKLHLIKYSKGVVIKIAKLFASFSVGLPYNEIQRIFLNEKTEGSEFIIDTMKNDKIVFSLKASDFQPLSQFLEEIGLKHIMESNIQDTRPTALESKTVYNTKHRKH